MRYNEAVNIIAKVKSTSRKSVVDLISSRNPFGLATNVRGISKYKADTLTLYSSNGVSYLESSNVEQGREFIKQYKIMISRVTSEHAGEPDKDGKYKVIAKIRLLKPNEICTDSYVIACPSEKREVTENFYSYLCTKLILYTDSCKNFRLLLVFLMDRRSHRSPCKFRSVLITEFLRLLCTYHPYLVLQHVHWSHGLSLFYTAL